MTPGPASITEIRTRTERKSSGPPLPGHYPLPVTREKLKVLLEEYGRIAIGTYLVIWLAVLAGFAIAIASGFRTASTEGGAGVLLGAWLATKLTQPLRIGATLLLTPLVAAVIHRLRRRPKPSDSGG